MADDRSDDHGQPPELNRPKRPPPTLDLAATDVSRPLDPPHREEVNFEAEPAAPDEATPPMEDIPPVPPPRASRTGTVLVGALSGAAAAALLLGLVWGAEWPIGTTAQDVARPQVVAAAPNNTALDDLAARMARIEARPVTSPALPATAPDLSAITGRLDALDKSIAALRDDLAAVRTQAEQNLAAVNDVKSAPREAPPAPDLSPITTRLSQIETAARAQAASIAAQTSALAKQSAKPADDAPLRRVVAASLLDLQVRQNEPYAAALAAAKPLAEDAQKLGALDGFAATGLPNDVALSRELQALLPKLAPAQAVATTGTGIIDRLQAGAARLVKIERTDVAIGNDNAAIVSRASVAARQNDVASAARELKTLAPADRAIVQPWLDKVAARDAALAAARQFAADATTSLNKPVQ